MRPFIQNDAVVFQQITKISLSDFRRWTKKKKKKNKIESKQKEKQIETSPCKKNNCLYSLVIHTASTETYILSY